MTDQEFLFDDVPVYATSWDPQNLGFPVESDFHSAIQDWLLQGEMEVAPDALLDNRPAPRTWLLLYEPGQGNLAATAALALARDLTGRDQSVLILDCDDEDPVLARWADRLDREGWIDLIRYGASLMTSSERLPFPGRQGLLIGPGSYRPVDAQPGEIVELLGRLRRQADDILLCCPIGDAGRAWATQAEIRALCWDASRLDRATIEALGRGFLAAGTPLTGVLRFGHEAAVADAPEDAMGGMPPAAGKPNPEGAPESEPVLATTPPVGRIEAPADPGRADNWEERRTSAAETPPSRQYARKRGTSRVFWWIAVGALALILGSVWYYRAFVMVTSLDGDPVAVRNENEMPADARTPHSPDAVSDETDHAGGPVSVPDSTGIAHTDSATVATVAEVVADTTRSEEPAEPEFFMDPYLVPVGADGWALHIYSFPNEETAAVELRELERRGFQTAVRAVQIKDKGRWQRVYLGSFPDRAAANEALGPLLKELGEDWGRPTKF